MKRILLAAVLALTTVAASNAQSNSGMSTNEFSRKGTWEVYGFGHATEILNLFESDATILGGGVGVGYNFAQHFTLAGDLSLSSAQFEGGPLSWFQDRTTALFMAHVYAEYNILKYAVTPVLSGGLGVGAFSDGSGTALDQTIGLGVRWDASDRVVFKAIVRTGAIETTDSHNHASANGWASLGISISLGYKF